MTTFGTAVIVGVGPGLGLALARTFADAGHPIALLARDTPRLDSYFAALNTSERAARAYTADAADPTQLRAAIHAAIDDLGAPDVLIYNAAVLRPDSPTDGDDDGWVNALTVDVLGAKVAAETVHPALRDGRGSLLFTGGGLALNPTAQYASLSVARPHSAPTCRPSTPSSPAPVCTPPASPTEQQLTDLLVAAGTEAAEISQWQQHRQLCIEPPRQPPAPAMTPQPPSEPEQTDAREPSRRRRAVLAAAAPPFCWWSASSSDDRPLRRRASAQPPPRSGGVRDHRESRRHDLHRPSPCPGSDPGGTRIQIACQVGDGEPITHRVDAKILTWPVWDQLDDGRWIPHIYTSTSKTYTAKAGSRHFRPN
jgi:hypothetical protein